MNGILEWEVFAYKFRGNPQAAFETLAYHMFCRKYHMAKCTSVRRCGAKDNRRLVI